MRFFDTHFSAFQFYGFTFGILLGIASIIFFLRNRMVPSVTCIFLAGLIFRLLMAGIDPYLHLWDEQYHALVAKNMMDHPFKPMLYANPALRYDMENWSANHIWLHKQPLFLWQIAASFKIFGVNEFALRLPSAIMSALCVLLIFRIGKLMANERIGWCAAFLFAFSNFNLEVATGIMHTDHNDVAFMFYVTASIWVLTEYMQDPEKNGTGRKMKWVILIGVLSGMAIMVKWLTGLLVFSGWFMAIFFDKTRRKSFIFYKDMIYAFLITLLVMLPWQIYQSIVFPAESAIEYKYNNLHLSTAVEGHGGTWWFHFEQIGLQLGVIVPFIIIPGILFLLKGMQELRFKIAFLTWLIVCYLFFMIVPTKMPLLCYSVMPLLFLGLGALLEKVMAAKINYKYVSYVVPFLIALVVAFVSLDTSAIEGKHTDQDPKMHYRNTRLHNCDIAKKAATLLPNKNFVLFNCKATNSILMMFYTGCTAAYDWYPNEADYLDLKRRNLKMAVFVDQGIPEYLANDPDVFKLNMELISN